MKITPSISDLRNWAKLAPADGDLLFFDKRYASLMKSMSAPVLTADEVRAQSLSLWNLSARSWYGYALNRSKFAVHLPVGSLEHLKRDAIEELAQIQIKLSVPSLIHTKYLPDEIAQKFIKVGRYRWITSQAYRSLPDLDTRANVISSWMQQNEIHSYQSLRLDKLPTRARGFLKSVGLEKYLNTYAPISGPNCLATAAAVAGSNPTLVMQWLHWAPLKSFLKSQSYKSSEVESPNAGDILVFVKDSTATHAAFYIGDNLYFEKPGQDFYEPWRIEYFDRWESEWPDAKLSIFRKT